MYSQTCLGFGYFHMVATDFIFFKCILIEFVQMWEHDELINN